jgi:hypothetical protein
MRPYSVQWRLVAIEALFQIWIVSGNVAEVGRATNQIESVLASNPEPSDSTEHEGLRVVSVGRLRVAYEVNHSGRTVEICGVQLLD